MMIYKTNMDRVDKLTLTKGELIGEINKINKVDTDFKDGTSNNIPVGSKILSPKKEGTY